VRRVLAPAIVLVLGALAVIQLGSYGLFGRAAAEGTLPRTIPRGAGVRVYDVLAKVPFLTFAHVVAATAAIEDRRFAYAQSLIDGLPRGADRDDTQGRLDEALGEHERAVARYVAAGDLVRVSDAVDALDREGKGAAALTIQRRLVAELEALHDTDSLAHAYWRLAELESETGDHSGSLLTYRRALALEPLSETYLLGAANEAMGHGELPFARTLFERVVSLDPGSADGHIGVGRAALRAGDVVEARRQLAIARRLAPAYFDLGRLEKEIESAPDRSR
jgi:tetratricopeptide (TPR) repeat protein